MIIRPATVDDLPAINAIYNHYVLSSTCTYQTIPSTADERLAWFQHHGEQHPIIVLELPEPTDSAPHDPAERIVGWASLSRFHSRQAFDRTVENSVYIKIGCERRGFGKMLLVDLLQRAAELKHHAIIAAISADQPGSLKLHAALGFVEKGRLTEVGYKFEQWLDVVYMQLTLPL